MSDLNVRRQYAHLIHRIERILDPATREAFIALLPFIEQMEYDMADFQQALSDLDGELGTLSSDAQTIQQEINDLKAGGQVAVSQALSDAADSLNQRVQSLQDVHASLQEAVTAGQPPAQPAQPADPTSGGATDTTSGTTDTSGGTTDTTAPTADGGATGGTTDVPQPTDTTSDVPPAPDTSTGV